MGKGEGKNLENDVLVGFCFAICSCICIVLLITWITNRKFSSDLAALFLAFISSSNCLFLTRNMNNSY